MTAVERSKIKSVDFLTMITPKGKILHQYMPEFFQGFEENFIIDTSEYRMPNESFYLRLDGEDNRKSNFYP